MLRSLNINRKMINVSSHRLSTMLVLLSAVTITACETLQTEKDESTEETTIQFSTKIDDQNWDINTTPQLRKTRAGEGAVSATYFLFDSDGNLLDKKQANKANQTIGLTAKGLGTYMVYSITNMSLSELAKIATPTDPISFSGGKIKDVAVGNASVKIETNVTATPVLISAKHMLSKLSLLVKNVPADINYMSASIPNLYTSFSLDGSHNGDSIQNIALTKDETVNTDGTYNWRIQEAILQAYSKSDESMLITIIANSNTATVTKQKKSNYILRPGVYLSLTTSFDNNSGIIGGTEIDDWENIEDPNSDFGSSIISPANRFKNTDTFILSEETKSSGETTLTLMSTVPTFGTLSQLQSEDAFKGYTLADYPNAKWRIPEVTYWSTFLHWVTDGNIKESQMAVLMQGIGGIPLDSNRSYLFFNDKRVSPVVQYTTGWNTIPSTVTDDAIYGVYPITTITITKDSDNNINM